MRKYVVPSLGLMLTLTLLFARGSVLAAGDHAAAGQTQVYNLTATLTGPVEVPPGDPDGQGTATVTLDANTGQVCYRLNVSNIILPAIGAHIHKGAPGVAGPIVVPFTAPDADGKANGCVKADVALVKAIGASPADYYVNVHTTDFKPGAVRGQLAKAAQQLPNTGMSSLPIALLAGLALLVLCAGLGLRRRARATT
jgi:LPXTG-motif cell wall-anchored protein